MFEFEGFSLDPDQRLLFGTNGKRVPLTSRAFDTLSFMVAHPGELLDKDTLMKAIWPNVVVEENNLNQSVAALRRALGESPDDHRFIVTIPGRGYRFVARVEVMAATPERGAGPSGAPSRSEISKWRRSPAVLWIGVAVAILVLALGSFAWLRRIGAAVTGSDQPSLAVLPFVDSSLQKDQGYFIDGLSEELLNQLGQLDGLRVTGRASSFYFKGRNEDLRTIGKMLDVRNILEGSVRKSGNEIRVTAELVDATTGYQLWTQSYDRELKDVFAIEEDIAASVTTALSIKLGVGALGRIEGGTRNVEAFDEYQKGVSLSAEGSFDADARAIDHFERASDLDPSFALPWVSVANRLGLLYSTYPPGRAEPLRAKQQEALARARELAPGAPAVIGAMTTYYQSHQQWMSVDRILRKRIARPGKVPVAIDDAYGFFLLNVGRASEAIDFLRKDVQRNPLGQFPWANLSVAYAGTGNIKEALAEQDLGLSRVPGGAYNLRDVYLATALATHDRSLIDKRLHLMPDAKEDPTVGAINAAIGPLLDDRQAALSRLRGIFADLPPRHPRARYVIAAWAAYFGDPALSLEAYKSLDAPTGASATTYLAWNAWHPLLRDMRKLPGFKDLVRNIGLVDYWRESGHWGDFCHPVGKNDFECE